ncbi:helix-turn-helix transcriptional regulator [Brasilonema sp. UFV-L1]|uniref:response regulator transcription factor n=1 Tax=Brasilonema sp. UFV-L1 TaxID=2234130 RepID=UPI00145F66A2|nr:helix-turn-helix transcriptional regulator [Brasilonema sp. UFV-L1]NMG10498.1 helix-turn-helix transcriptional regulator [Brasilonema sp. UFV-L1]
MKTHQKNHLLTASDNQYVLSPEKEAQLKALLLQVDVAASAPYKVLQSTEQIVNEVIFESDVDGVQYYVVRCRLKFQEKISLSPREKAIAKLVAQGLPNKSIGIRLDISPWTVATHLRRIFVKLGVTSRTAMIARVFKEDLLKE